MKSSGRLEMKFLSHYRLVDIVLTSGRQLLTAFLKIPGNVLTHRKKGIKKNLIDNGLQKLLVNVKAFRCQASMNVKIQHCTMPKGLLKK
jgi:hypothetical protein